MGKKVLVIEDDSSLASNLKEWLELEGYSVDTAPSGEEGQEALESNRYDLVLLDIMLPGASGIEVYRRLRQKKISTPVIMMTGESLDEIAEVNGLNCGADDYLLKPFTPARLIARIQAALGREHLINQQDLKVGELILCCRDREVILKNKRVSLTIKECALLELLMKNHGRVTPRSVLEKQLQNRNSEISSNELDVYIGKIRKKLKTLTEEAVIETVKGDGLPVGFFRNLRPPCLLPPSVLIPFYKVPAAAKAICGRRSLCTCGRIKTRLK